MRPSSALFVACAVWATACTDDLDDPDLASAELPSTNLDPSPIATAEAVMVAGRMNKVPASWVFHGARTQTGAHTMRFRANCVFDVLPPPADACDPALIVYAEQCTTTACTAVTGDVLHNRDASASTANALVQRTAPRETRYQVVAYSQNRGTSYVNVQWSLDGVSWSSSFVAPGTTTSYSGGSRRVGGTLVRVGAVRPGDNIGVRTIDDGAALDHRTRLYAISERRDRFAFVDGDVGADRDPVMSYDAGWTATATSGSAVQYVLVAKDSLRLGVGNEGLETRVDLVAGPVGVTETLVAFNGGSDCVGTSSSNSTDRVWCSGTAATLPPGRYNAWVYASTNGRGVGHAGSRIEAYPASDLGAACGDYPRGHGNDLGFIAHLKRDGQIIATRYVPRGGIGSDASWSRIGFDFEVADDLTAHAYTIDVTSNAVRVRGTWGYTRNPERVEVKIASLNIEPWTDDHAAQNNPRLRNAADVLGTRGSFNTTIGSIDDPANRGKWQWEADILVFQEILGTPEATVMYDRLVTRTPYGWSMKRGLGKENTTRIDTIAPVMANEFVTPGPMAFSASAMASAGGVDGSDAGWINCTTPLSSTQGSDTWACRISRDTTWNDENNFVVPAKVAARRMKGSTGGTQNRPIVVLNAYMHDSDLEDREEGVDNLIPMVDDLIAADPGAFNVLGEASPTSDGNRFILIGDSNMANHQCAEFNHHLRKLRDHYGYAIDVSQAALDANLRTMDMHYSGAPLNHPDAGRYGDCGSPDWAVPATDATGNACPFRFKHADAWEDESARWGNGVDQWFPWWAGTSSNSKGGGSSKLDIMILVGKGWAYDDPLVHYAPMSDVDAASISNGYQGGGVEIGWCADEGDGGMVSDPGSYIPTNTIDLEACPGGPGSPAFYSDHKPMGAKLKVNFAR